MDFSQLLNVLKARVAVFLGALLTTVAITVVLSMVIPPQYTASTSVVVDYKGVDPVLGVMMPVQMMPSYLATQVDIIKSRKVALEVVKALRISENSVARAQWQEETQGKGGIEDWFAEALLKKLEVEPSRDSSVVRIAYSGSDPRFAAGIANAFAEAYQRINLELRVEPARLSAAWFDERLQQLRKKLEEAQVKLNAYQREKGFTAQDERLDLEQGRLTELSGQYSNAQAQAADGMSRQRQLNEFLNRGASAETIPDVLANPLVQSLKSQLALTEGRLQQATSQLGKNHPEVKRLEADIESQKAKLKSEITSAASSVINSAKIAQRRAAELQAALAEQKARLLRLNQGRDEQQVLVKEVESAQRAYDAAAQRFQQTNLESQASQTNIAILAKAAVPIEASFPKLGLNIILSIVLGAMIGVGIALLVEMLDRRVRTARDLAAATQSLVLGVMQNDRKTRSGGRSWASRSKKKGAGKVVATSMQANAG
jgi:succinoglycan biosynthesis transport protein ExoP